MFLLFLHVGFTNSSPTHLVSRKCVSLACFSSEAWVSCQKKEKQFQLDGRILHFASPNAQSTAAVMGLIPIRMRKAHCSWRLLQLLLLRCLLCKISSLPIHLAQCAKHGGSHGVILIPTQGAHDLQGLLQLLFRFIDISYQPIHLGQCTKC